MSFFAFVAHTTKSACTFMSISISRGVLKQHCSTSREKPRHYTNSSRISWKRAIPRRSSDSSDRPMPSTGSNSFCPRCCVPGRSLGTGTLLPLPRPDPAAPAHHRDVRRWTTFELQAYLNLLDHQSDDPVDIAYCFEHADQQQRWQAKTQVLMTEMVAFLHWICHDLPSPRPWFLCRCSGIPC